MKKTYAVPTKRELRELFEAQSAEHANNDDCQICQLKNGFAEDPAVQQLLLMCLALAVEGTPFITSFAHFFRAGMLWQEKQSGIVKDGDELTRLFNICDDRNEKTEKS